MTEEIYVNDRWLWSEIVIRTESCDCCGNGQAIVIKKGKELKKLIDLLNKFNYKGISKSKIKSEYKNYYICKNSKKASITIK